MIDDGALGFDSAGFDDLLNSQLDHFSTVNRLALEDSGARGHGI